MLLLQSRSIFCLLLAVRLGARRTRIPSSGTRPPTAWTPTFTAKRSGRCWRTSPRQTGWHIFVEPGAARNASAKFKDLPSGDALKMLLGNLNFALVPETNGPSQLYVFTHHDARTPRSRCARRRAPPKHVPNELLVKVKPGTDIDALAKSLGAKIIGRDDKLGIYRLQFADAAATDAALAQLKNNSDVLAVDYNYYFDPPPTPQLVAGPLPPRFP